MVDTQLSPADGSGLIEPARIKLGRFKLLLSIVAKVIFFTAAAIFCLWQIAFVIFSLFLVLPELVPEIWIAYRYFDMPLLFFVLIVSFFFLPIVCLAVIVWLFLTGGKKRYQLVLKFFYGFELPALLLLGLYLVNLRDYALGMGWLLLIATVAMGFWCALVFHERRCDDNSESMMFVDSRFAMAGSSVVFAVGVYVSLALLLFVVPLLSQLVVSVIESVVHLVKAGFYLDELWKALVSLDWTELFSGLGLSFASIPIIALVALAFTSMGLVLVLPFVLIYLYIGQFISRLRQSRSVHNAVVAVLVVAVLIGVHVGTNHQPQQGVFAMLEQEPQTANDKRVLVDRQGQIRDGLMNAYLSRYRYLSSTGTASLLTHSYADAFAIDRAMAKYPQKLINFLFKPILYNGDSTDDMVRAAEAYEQHFDVPIQKAELEEIWRTLRFNSNDSRQNASGLLDVSQESVYLQRQSIDVRVEQQLATIRVTQKLVNKELRQLETVVHFSLPEYAVITGVWLSNNESNLEQFGALVAPRGAAQEVYNTEVSRRIDPALLEKVGPELYRLRVYPIEAAYTENRYEVVDGKPMFVTFEYQTLANDHDFWPVPVLLEKRHLFWDENTIDTVNGVQIKRNGIGSWIPIDAGMQQRTKQVITEFKGSANHAVWAVPRSYLHGDSSDKSKAASSENIVVLIDGSRSMERHADNVLAALKQMPQATLYFCQKTCEATSSQAIAEHVYWGNSKPIEQLEAFLSGGTTPDTEFIVLLTDDGSYEAESDTQAVLSSVIPVWVQHLGESRPYAYSDAWLTTINQSGGGFTTGEVSDLLNRLSLLTNSHTLKLQGVDARLLDKLDLTGIDKDWLWFDGPALVNDADSHTYEKLGAALQIGRITKSGQSLGLEQLDELHDLALQAQIITELSSMLVLVDDRQREALEEASNKDDRFDRENEDGTQVVGMPNDTLAVAGVPEPHEWALFIIVMVFVTMSLHRRRQGYRIPEQYMGRLR